MATYPPPTQNQAIFNASNFSSSGDVLTEAVANTLYLKYPISQGSETITGELTVSGGASIAGNVGVDSEFTSTLRAFLDGGVDVGDTANFGSSVDVGTNLILSGTANTNYIEFPDGTQQFTAGIQSPVFNTNITANENIIFPNAGSYIQFPDGSRLLSANGTSTVSSTNVYTAYNTSSPTTLTNNLKPFVNYAITPVTGTPRSFFVLAAGGGGNNGTNNTSAGATRYYGGSGGAGGALSTGVTYSTAQTASTIILNCILYPDIRNSTTMLTLSVGWAGACTSTSGSKTLTRTGDLSGYTASNFQSIVAGSIVYCVLNATASRPYIISAWVFNRSTTTLTTGINALDTYTGVSAPTTATPILYYVYNSSNQYDATGTLTFGQTTGTLTSVTLNSLSGTPIEVGWIIAGYSATSTQAFYSYVAAISGSVPNQVITLANQYAISGTWTAGGNVYYASKPVNGECYHTSIANGTKILGTSFGGLTGGNATSTAVGTAGTGGRTILDSTNGYANNLATGSSGSVGYTNTTPFLTGATTQAFNSLVTSNNTTTSISTYSVGGYTSSSTNPNTTVDGGVGCIFVQTYT